MLQKKERWKRRKNRGTSLVQDDPGKNTITHTRTSYTNKTHTHNIDISTPSTHPINTTMSIISIRNDAKLEWIASHGPYFMLLWIVWLNTAVRQVLFVGTIAALTLRRGGIAVCDWCRGSLNDRKKLLFFDLRWFWRLDGHGHG